MCRSIRVLRKLDPPAGEEEIQQAALQYVRKISGYRQPSAKNTEAFQRAVREVATATDSLLVALSTKRS